MVSGSCQSEPVVLSAEIFAIPFDGSSYIVYAPRRKAAFVANSALVNKIADIKEGAFAIQSDEDAALVEFLCRLEIVGGGQEPDPSTHFRGKPAPTQVSLFLTTACNLRCSYCYASAGDTPARFMGIETAKRAIDFIVHNAIDRSEKTIRIIFHGGGEPTVHWRLLTESLRYARELCAIHGLEVKASGGTNGVISDEQRQWIAANLDNVTISFDGAPETHDTHRLTVLGQPSSMSVMETMKYFDSVGFPYGIRMTVTADQTMRLPESVAFICARYHPTRIQVEPSYQLGRWHGSPTAETEDFIRAFREAALRAACLGAQIVYSAARIDTLTNHFCGITQDSFSVTPDGDVSACFEVFSRGQAWSDTFLYGAESGAAGYEFDMRTLDTLRSKVVNNNAFCSGCFAKWHCAGDCHHKALNINGAGEFTGSDRCHITRELTKDALLTRIAQSGGVFWHGEAAEDVAVGPGKEFLL